MTRSIQLQNLKFIGDFCNYMIYQRRYKHHSSICYRKDLIQFCSFFDDELSLANIGQSDVDRFTSEGLAKYAPASKARKIATIKSFYKFMRTCSLCSFKPNIKAPHIEKKPIIECSQEDIQKLFEQMNEENPYQLRDKCIFHLCIYCGLKPSEILRFCICDVNWSEPHGISRLGNAPPVMLDKKFMATLSKYMLHRRSHNKNLDKLDHIFVNRHGRRLSARSIRRKLTEYVKKAGLNSDINPLTLRHNYAKRAVLDGVDVVDLSLTLHHTNLSTTKAYVKFLKGE